MTILIAIPIIMILSIVIYNLISIKNEILGDGFVNLLQMMSVTTFLFCFFIEILLIGMYYTSGKEVEIINEAYGTNYTQEDMFYGKDYIKQIIKDKK